MVSVNCDLVFTVNLTVYVALNRSIYVPGFDMVEGPRRLIYQIKQPFKGKVRD